LVGRTRHSDPSIAGNRRVKIKIHGRRLHPLCAVNFSTKEIREDAKKGKNGPMTQALQKIKPDRNGAVSSFTFKRLEDGGKYSAGTKCARPVWKRQGYRKARRLGRANQGGDSHSNRQTQTEREQGVLKVFMQPSTELLGQQAHR